MDRDIIVGGLWAVFGIAFGAVIAALTVSDLAGWLHGLLLLGGVFSIGLCSGSLGVMFFPPKAKVPEPDMSIQELFRHIDPNVPILDQTPERFERIADKILEALAAGRLAGFARVLYWPESTGPREQIDAATWKHMTLNPDIFQSGGRVAHLLYRPDTSGPIYTDVQVNRSEAYRVWPKKAKCRL